VQITLCQSPCEKAFGEIDEGEGGCGGGGRARGHVALVDFSGDRPPITGGQSYTIYLFL